MSLWACAAWYQQGSSLNAVGFACPRWGCSFTERLKFFRSRFSFFGGAVPALVMYLSLFMASVIAGLDCKADWYMRTCLEVLDTHANDEDLDRGAMIVGERDVMGFDVMLASVVLLLSEVR